MTILDDLMPDSDVHEVHDLWVRADRGEAYDAIKEVSPAMRRRQ